MSYPAVSTGALLLRRIQDEANVAILGADSAESGHSHDDGDSALLEVVADNTFDVVGNDGDEEDEEVAAVNAADENVDENVAAVTMLRPHPQSLPAFVGRGFGVPIAHSPAFVVHGVGVSSAVSSSASRGGGATRKTNTPSPPRRTPTSLSSNISSRGDRGEKR